MSTPPIFDRLSLAGLLLTSALVAGCGGGGGGSGAGSAPTQFTVGGSVVGLTGGGLTLRLNGSNDRVVNSDGSFSFAPTLPSGSAYTVTVASQPTNPSQTCVINNGSGAVASFNVVTVRVVCETNRYVVGGDVTGMAGTGLRLRLHTGEELVINGSGIYGFTTTVPSGVEYSVSIVAQPVLPYQTCTITNRVGTIANQNVSVPITCTTNSYAVGGRVAGLQGTGLELRLNGGNDLVVGANGAFTFPTTLASGATYDVRVKTRPTGPEQTCVVSSGAGTVFETAVSSVLITCTSAPARFLYAESPQGLYCYAINPTDRRLTQFGGSPCAGGFYTDVSSEPTGRFIYATDPVRQEIVPFAIDQMTGLPMPIPGAARPTGVSPVTIQLVPSGEFLYVGNYSGTVSGFRVNAVDGSLTPLAGSPFASGAQLNSLTVDGSGAFLYGGASEVILGYSINGTTGALTPLPGSPYDAGVGSGGSVFEVALSPSGSHAYATVVRIDRLYVYVRDSATGELEDSPVASFASESQPQGLLVDSTGTFVYVANQATDRGVYGFAINQPSGNVNPLLRTPYARQGKPIRIIEHPAGGTLYISGTDYPGPIMQGTITYTLGIEWGNLLDPLLPPVNHDPLSVINVRTMAISP